MKSTSENKTDVAQVDNENELSSDKYQTIKKDTINSFNALSKLVNQTTDFTNLSNSQKLFASKKYDSLYGVLKVRLDSLTGDEMRYLGFMHLHGYGIKQNFKEAKVWLEKSMAVGNLLSLTLIGYIYEKGLGVSQNYNQAALFYSKAADKGDPLGLNNLGYLYENGYGVERDLKKAFTLYSNAAAKGDNLGRNNQGWALIHGIGVAPDQKKGFELLRQSALSGNLRGMKNLGMAYEQGYGINRDLDKANKWYNKSDSLRNVIQYNSKF